MNPRELRPVICLAKHSEGISYSESFIRAHVERLNGRVITLFGPIGVRSTPEARPLWSQTFLARGVRRAIRLASGTSVQAQESPTVARFLRRHRVDVVLAEYGPTACGLIDATRKAGVPLVAHFHGYDAHVRTLVNEHAKRYRVLFEHARAIVAVSQLMRARLIALGAPPEKIAWIPCGADAPPNKVNLQHGRFISIGRFVGKKSPLTTLLAFGAIVELCANARLTMIGDGPFLPAAIELRKALGLENHVEFPGSLLHAEVLQRLRQSGCFLQHSVTASDGDSEGTPVALLEAMAHGIPPVTTRHAGIADVVEDRVTGHLVDEYDLQAMVSRMREVITNPEKAEEMGSAARQAVISKWSMQHSIRRLDSLLRRIVAGQPVGGGSGLYDE